MNRQHDNSSFIGKNYRAEPIEMKADMVRENLEQCLTDYENYGLIM